MVFLSYQRRSGANLARYIHDRLIARGVDVFFDVEDINGGRFASIIEHEIITREYFVVILTPSTLESEWVQREIGVALREHKLIVPLMAEGFSFSQPLPPEIAGLGEYSGIPFDYQYADAAFARLERALGLPPEAPPPPRSRLRNILSSPVWQGIGGLVAILALILAYWAATRDNNPPPVSPTATSAAFVPTTAAPPAPTVTPAPKATATPTLTPTLTPTPSLARVGALDDTLAGRSLTDVAAANGHVWFASRTGLIHYDEANETAQIVNAVPDDLETLAVDPSGAVIWFGSGAEGRIGRYTLGSDQVEWFTLAVDQQLPVTALQMGPKGLPWIGIQNGVVLRPVREGEWELLPIPQTISGFFTLKALALDPNNPDLAWVAEAFSVHRWHDQWDSYDPARTGDKLVIPVNAVVVDGYGRAWFGHREGVTVQTEDQRGQTFVQCNAPGGGAALGVVLDLATSDAGRALWIVTRGRLVRVDITARDLSEDCATWPISEWGEYLTFWENEFGDDYTDYRLAVEDDRALWVIRRDTGKVRRLTIE